MSSTPATFVGSGVDQGTDWTSPGSVTAEDGVSAQVTTFIGPFTSSILRCTMGANLLSVPGTPTGVLVEIKCTGGDDSALGTQVIFATVTLVEGGAEIGTNQAASVAVPQATLTWVSFGGSGNLMGATGLSTAQVNSGTFGVDVAFSDANSGANGSVSVDAVRITVFYTGTVDEDLVRRKRQRQKKMGYQIKQNQTAQPLEFWLYSSTDHITPVTGLGSAPAVTLSKNGGAWAAAAGAVSEVGNGKYKVAGNATDSNTLGPLSLHATGTGADAWDDEFQVVAFDPQDAVRMGIGALPNALAEALGGLFTRGTGAGQINQNANGQIDARAVDADAAALATIFTVNTGSTYGASVAGSVVHEIANNAMAGGLPINFSSMKISPAGYMYLGGVLSTDLTETAAGQLAGGFKKWFDVSAPAYTLNNVNDAYTRIGSGGAGLTNLGDTRLAFLDVSVNSRLAASAYTAPLSASATTSAVLDATLSSHLTAGSVGAAINSASSAGNPWTDTLASYTVGQAGYILKNYLTGDVYAEAVANNGVLANATYGNSALHTQIAALNNIAATDVWAAGTRTLTAIDKTGYSLSATGLDAIDVTAPTGAAGWNFRQLMVMLGRRFFKKSTLNKNTGDLIDYADDGTTAITTQVCTDDGTTQTQGAAV